MSVSTVYKLLSLQKIHAELRPLLEPPTPKAEQIRLSEGNVLAKIDSVEQVRIWLEAKKQPTHSLIIRKLYELGKPHFVVSAKASRDDARDTAKSLIRRISTLASLVMELRAVKLEEWERYARFGGSVQVSGDMSRLTEISKEMLEVKQVMSRARVAAREDLPAVA